MTNFEYQEAANNAINKANCESFDAFCAIILRLKKRWKDQGSSR